MGPIQGAVNSMIGTAAAAAALTNKLATKKPTASPQEAAAEQAQQSSNNEVTAKKKQRRNFAEYLARQKLSIGGTVGDLPKTMQKQIAAQYTKSQRKKLMDEADREAQNGKHK